MEFVIGLGSRIKRDDDIGNLVVEELKKRGLQDFEFLIAGNASENFLGYVKEKNPSRIFFVDAADFEGKLGEVKCFSVEDLSEVSMVTTHSAPLSLFRKFLPKTKIFVIGIKIKSTDFGTSLSKKVKEELPKIIKRVESIILQ
ncbi:hydrogenase maturation protease [Candidatus Woesearchaeota archaeon]|nr:hydrogenase maturation protease [Candidatus Woesearchaeota archaeon]